MLVQAVIAVHALNPSDWEVEVWDHESRQASLDCVLNYYREKRRGRGEGRERERHAFSR